MYLSWKGEEAPDSKKKQIQTTSQGSPIWIQAFTHTDKYPNSICEFELVLCCSAWREWEVYLMKEKYLYSWAWLEGLSLQGTSSAGGINTKVMTPTCFSSLKCLWNNLNPSVSKQHMLVSPLLFLHCSPIFACKERILWHKIFSRGTFLRSFWDNCKQFSKAAQHSVPCVSEKWKAKDTLAWRGSQSSLITRCFTPYRCTLSSISRTLFECSFLYFIWY